MIEDDDAQLICSVNDRRNAMGSPVRVDLYEDRLEISDSERVVRRIALSDITKVRLSVEMAGQETQIVCRVSGPSGQIVVGSRIYKSPGQWENNALKYRTFVLKLHQRLRDIKADVRYVEGQTLAFRVILSTLGGVITGLALVFGWYMFNEKDSLMLALAALPGLVVGGYLMWVFRPAIPLPYDPNGLIKRFESSETIKDTKSDSDGQNSG